MFSRPEFTFYRLNRYHPLSAETEPKISGIESGFSQPAGSLASSRGLFPVAQCPHCHRGPVWKQSRLGVTYMTVTRTAVLGTQEWSNWSYSLETTSGLFLGVILCSC